MMEPTPIPHAAATAARSATGPAQPPRDLMATARAFETAFLTEMLMSAGTARASEGSDPSPFESFMAEAQARALVAAGGLGLTAPIAAALARRSDSADAGDAAEGVRA